MIDLARIADIPRAIATVGWYATHIGFFGVSIAQIVTALFLLAAGRGIVLQTLESIHPSGGLAGSKGFLSEAEYQDWTDIVNRADFDEEED